MKTLSTLNLDRNFFTEREKTFVESGDMRARLFLYESGVQGIRIENKHGYLVALPYQGQQIWECNFLGRNLTMESTFKEPVITREYLETYGGFLLHCGATSMGVPSDGDNHPLHGELPNAPYQKAYLEIGEDPKGKFISLGGQYHHLVAFNSNYIAEPKITLYEDSTIIATSMTITNLKKTDMEIMYMMHINFKPMDNSELIYSADYNPEDVKVHINIPTHMKVDSGSTMEFERFLDNLSKDPNLHHVLKPGLPYDPEVVFIIKYKEDPQGNAHSMQVHPDGYASYVSHRPSQLKYGVRWISRTNDEDALGLVLPSTAGHRGYSVEKELGNIDILGAGEQVEYNVEFGLLTPTEAADIRSKIKNIKQAK